MTNPKDEIRTALKGVGLAKVNDEILGKCEYSNLPLLNYSDFLALPVCTLASVLGAVVAGEQGTHHLAFLLCSKQAPLC